ncbi:MAG: hypothetical protein KKG21_02175 [Candidatus Omnitrophica bacterium]|nr:hypothetical protein [Candidatus Omnitrophota bacterium]
MDYIKIGLVNRRKKSVLALGAQSKASLCFVKGDAAYLSESGGDLANLKDLKIFENRIKALKIKPEIIACDLHPEYVSTKLAKKLIAHSSWLIVKEIQHHEAHIASNIVDNTIKGNVIGIAFDGTGFGRDGNVWGGEFFIGAIKGLKRAAHLKYVPMPGGEASIREPRRMAFSYLYTSNLPILPILTRLDKDRLGLLAQMIDRGINSPLTSSMGRLFDAVAAMVGIRSEVKYEGQAAMELEKAISHQPPAISCKKRYDFKYKNEDGIIVIDWKPVIKGIVSDLQNKKTKAEISLKFHNAVCHMIKDVCVILRKKYKIIKVCMSGGVFQNRYLRENTRPLLEERGFKVYLHKRLPAHDGNIALGQAAIAAGI